MAPEYYGQFHSRSCLKKTDQSVSRVYYHLFCITTYFSIQDLSVH